MTDHLENAIRQLFRDTGPLDRDEVAVLLLDLLDRIQNIEAKPWVGLTQEDMYEIGEFKNTHGYVPTGFKRLAAAIEAKLKEKNT